MTTAREIVERLKTMTGRSETTYIVVGGVATNLTDLLIEATMLIQSLAARVEELEKMLGDIVQLFSEYGENEAGVPGDGSGDPPEIIIARAALSPKTKE